MSNPSGWFKVADPSTPAAETGYQFADPKTDSRLGEPRMYSAAGSRTRDLQIASPAS